MRPSAGELSPSRAVARRMHELESELQRARMYVRRYSKSPETTWRWGLEQPAEVQQEEGWFVTYLDMMTLLLVVMIVMLAFSGTLGERAGASSPGESPASEIINDGEAISSASDADIAPGADVGTRAAVMIVSSIIPPIPPAIPDLYPGWSATDLAASFIGPPKPTEAHIDETPVTDPVADVMATAFESGAPSHDDASPDGDMLVTKSLKHGDSAVALTAAGAGVPVSDETTAVDPQNDIAQDRDIPSEGETLAAELELSGLGNDIEVVVHERSVSFRINSEIIFDTSQADLSRSGLAVLQRIASVLSEAGHEVTVEGHTDSVPVRRNVRYPSNWELSSARAGSVVRYLQANGVNKSHLKAIGYADTRPIADNATPEGRARNRRVELVVEKRAP